MKILSKIGFIIALMLLAIIVSSSKSLADSSENPGQLYDNAVLEKIIDPNLYPKSDWIEDEETQMKPSYEIYKKTVSESTTYEEWLKLNNYGVMSDTKEPVLQKKSASLLRSRSVTSGEQNNINKFCNDTRAGDILIVGGDFPTGVIGHAAILNADNYVLEMPGGSNWFWGIADNNRQLPKRQWITEHIKEWTSVYRMRNTGLARQVAQYADTHYYSTTGSATKNIHLDYKITTDIKSVNPNYCSKLVWQAYYYGTGDLPVMYGIGNGVIAPTGLPALFTQAYAPYQLGRY